jgi:uncharacterized protein
MLPSRYNIVSRIEGTDQSVVVNLLSGNADVLGAAHTARLAEPGPVDDLELAAKGYIVDRDEEARRYRQAYLDFIDARDSDEIQLFYVPSYACNFDCSYCFQRSYETPSKTEQEAVLAAFFRYVDQRFAGRRKYVTLFGGEPLLPSETALHAVERIVAGTSERGLDLAVVTNGYHLERYLDVLSRARLREIQVTLDGPKPIHDGRRHLVGGQPSFDAIARGIDAALERNVAINLRTVLDRDNVGAYVELARFAMARGWTDHPRFKTQIGRNYELHECQLERDKLYTRLDLYKDLYRIAREHPELLRFHRPTFSVSRHLFDHGTLPSPLFDACPGTKTEWAFDYSGRIFACTATVGKASETLGTFWPEVQLDRDSVERWEERDVLSIEKCRSCTLQLACGGGCGAVAKNRTGTVAATDCRPVSELIGLGVSLYASRELLEP